MRVLYVAHAFWPYIGGLETISATLVAGLRERGYEFSVLTCREDPRLPPTDSWGGVPVHRLDLTSALTLRDAAGLATVRHDAAAIARDWEPDLVHLAFSPQAGYLTLGARLDRLAPLLVSFHGPWPVLEDAAGPTLTRRLLDSADWVTACSRASLEQVRGFEPGIAERSSWIPNGLEPASPPSAPPAAGEPLVVGLGRLSPEKGFDVLLRAFARLRRAEPRARLVLAGRGVEEGALVALARELGIAEAIDFHGWVRAADVPELLDRANVVAVPSREEGFGMTALEAAMRGRPVVATRTGGLPEVVDDGVTGVLVAPEAPDQLASAIASLLADRGRAARLGAAGRERAERLFSEERLLREHEELYGRLAPRVAAPIARL
jgi:glycosyltransferase involved in cell wall biosynthesis